jgi:two-component system NtrC family sensor kinase
VKFSDLSLRWKIPLRVTGAVLGTAIAVTSALVVREYDELRQSLDGHAKSLGRVLANTLVAPVMHNDIWRTFEVLRSARDTDDMVPELRAELVLVTDRNHRVFVSTRPREFPIGSDPATRGGVFPLLRAALAQGRPDEQQVVEPPDSSFYFVLSPLLADGANLGHVILGYSKASFAPRFFRLVERALIVTILVLAVIIPVSWVWARRTGTPILQLAEPMRRIPGNLDDIDLDQLPTGRDEFGQLGQAFRHMVQELRQKAELERQMLVTERLAAVGRLTAGIAHEINNPLGGMLTAISVHRRRGDDGVGAGTMSLLERGLTQIRNTVGALLVETRTQDRPFSPQDVGDLLILADAEAHTRSVRLIVDSAIKEPLPLPATSLRQILLNLLLNAVKAADQGGFVHVCTRANGGTLEMLVCNDGRFIPQEQLSYLFEPFANTSTEGHGLGLWMVYQIVQQLGGAIAVESEPGCTTFTVQIPYVRNA